MKFHKQQRKIQAKIAEKQKKDFDQQESIIQNNPPDPWNMVEAELKSLDTGSP